MAIDLLSDCEARQCPLTADLSSDVTDMVTKAYIVGYYAGASGLAPEISPEDARWIHGRPQPAAVA